MKKLDTLPKNLLSMHRKYGDEKIAMRKKDLGIWIPYSWGDSFEQVRQLCLGLIALGLNRGDKVCIIGDNDPEYFWAQLAIQAAGGVAVGIFTDSTPKEIEFVVNHSDSVMVFAKDQEQCDKLLEIEEEVSQVLKVIYWDEKGLWGYEGSWMASYENIQEIGRQLGEKDPDLFQNSVEEGSGDDLAVYCYTSGTTGLPKGAMISHNNLLSGARSAQKADERIDTDEYVSFLPPAWITENVLGLAVHLLSAMIVNFPESPDTVQPNIRETTPQAMLFSAGLWESMVGMVQVKIAETTKINQLLYKLFMPVGYKVASLRYEQHQEIPLLWTIAHRLGEFALYHPLRDKLGLTKVKSAYSSGAALNPQVIRFFRAIGVNIKQLYGSTEAQVHTLHIGNDVKFETVGVPAPGVNVKIGDDGEILISSGNLFQGYYKNPEATEKAILVDEKGERWFQTGDAGYLDDDGHLIYLDRMKEMIMLSSGEKYSPQFIEGQLKFSQYVGGVMSIGGDDKPFVGALINMDYDNVGRWAEKEGIAYTTYVDLSQKKEVYDLISKDVERVNKSLPPAARIKRFVLLHKEFDADEGELTRTRKLRRSLLSERYGQMITAIYDGSDMVDVRAEVKYRDGREGVIETSVRVATMDISTEKSA